MTDITADRPTAPAASVGERAGAPGKRRLLIAAAVAVITFATALTLILINTSPSTDPASVRGAERVVATSAASLEAQGSPPSLIATFRDGQVTATRTVGDEPFDAHTPFYLGSLSKSFTATTVARLVDRGRLRLDEPVRSYLPWFRTRSGAAERITIRHLLNQTSGVPTGAGMVDLNAPDTSLRQRVRDLRRVDLDSAPGTKFQYSNKNFATLALVVEQVTGRSYAEALRREVIAPLGLRETVTDPKAAHGRDVSEGSLAFFGAHIPVSMPPFPGALADGYVVSTAHDLARFGDVLATGVHDGDRYLSRRSLAMMHSAPRGVEADPDYAATYGFGVRLKEFNGRRAVWHEGELAGAHTDLGVLPATRTGLVMLATHNGQLFSADDPFFAGMDVLAGARPADGAADGGYRAVALVISAVAALLLGWIVLDVMRWPGLLRAPRSRRLVRSAGPRAVLAIAVWAGVFYGLGAAFGVEGALPIALSWQGASDLTAVVLTLVGYLGLSSVVLATWPSRGARLLRQAKAAA